LSLNSKEIEKPGDRLTRRQYLALHLRHRFALDYVVGKRVLDVGCGAGMGLYTVAERASSVLALDQDEEAVRIASRIAHPRVEVRQADAHAIPSPDAAFDTVLCLATMIYLDVPRFVSECHRVLARGGVFVGGLPNPEGAGFVPSRDSRNYPRVAELDDCLKSRGFESLFWGVRYAPAGGRGAYSSTYYKMLLPQVMRVLNRLPQARRIKTLLQSRMPGLSPVSPALKLEELEDAYRGCEIVRLDPRQETSSFEGFFFVATRV
jgi:SAM-dependent methyltransferase